MSAFLSNASNKFYLTHFDCYLKSKADDTAPKILGLKNISIALLQFTQSSINAIDNKFYKKSTRKPYFLSVEGFHPISSYLLFRIDRVCHSLEHVTNVEITFKKFLSNCIA